jgi:hypothetical protein
MALPALKAPTINITTDKWSSNPLMAFSDLRFVSHSIVASEMQD